MAGVYREAWSGRVLDFLTNSDQDSFLEGIEDMSQHVSNAGNENQVIHMTDLGVVPDVLINNTTYPIPEQALDGDDIPIQLDKFVTKVTPITDDELYAITYDKMAATVKRHGLSIKISRAKKAIHALAPSGNTAAMPVLLTTGADDGTGRKRAQWSDVADLKAQLDTLEYPEEGRRLVLCKDHENDLIVPNQLFANQFYNRESGKIFNQYGFDIYGYASNPFYRPSTKAKLSFGATPLGTDRRASVFFSLARAVKAIGWTKMYYSEAKVNPSTQKSTVNFRHYAIVMPTTEEARGALVSDNV